MIEEHYNKYKNDITKWIPEGIIDVNIETLQKYGLLSYHDRKKYDPHLTRYFHVIESNEKITLINELFVVWIVPDKIYHVPITYVLIALNKGEYPHLEMAFSTSGVYNSSNLVLRVLEKILEEVQDTEDSLSSLWKAS